MNERVNEFEQVRDKGAVFRFETGHDSLKIQEELFSIDDERPGGILGRAFGLLLLPFAVMSWVFTGKAKFL